MVKVQSFCWQRELKSYRGFTLLEMLVVLAIIGILSSIIVVGLAQVQARGRDTRRIKDLSEVQQALEFYLSKNGKYPPTESWSSLTSDLLAAGINISTVPNDPLKTRGYGYCSTTDSPQRYVLAAFLEDQSNSNLSQYPASTVFPCTPDVVGTPSNPACSMQTVVTNKFCLIF